MQQTLIDFYDPANKNPDPLIIEHPTKQGEKTFIQMTNAFIKFHTENPQVYEAFKEITLETYRKNYDTFSIKAVVEIFRWQYNTETNDKKFKFCNNHHSFYARLLACDFAHLRHWFRFKKGKPDNAYFYDWLKKNTEIEHPVAVFFGKDTGK